MPTMPWTPGPERPAADTPVVVMASRLELRRYRDVPGFLRAAMALRRELRTADGAVGLALAAQPLRKTFWTLSAWRDDAALRGYTRNPTHVAVMRRYHDRMAQATFRTWTEAAGTAPPDWAAARARLAVPEGAAEQAA